MIGQLCNEASEALDLNDLGHSRPLIDLLLLQLQSQADMTLTDLLLVSNLLASRWIHLSRTGAYMCRYQYPHKCRHADVGAGHPAADM